MAVEFARDITFGQYLDLRSPVHRLDPRAKILALAALMPAIFLVGGFAGLLVLLLCALCIQALSRVPPSYTLRGMRLLLATMIVIAIFQVLFFPNPAAETTIWRWGVLSISGDGLRLAALTFMRVLLLYHLTSTLLFTTALMDLADGMEVLLGPLKRLRVPVNELVMVVVIALKFVPLLVAELERLIKAQTARGARFDRGGLVQRARKLGALLIPLFVSAFGRAETLTTAMEARCYRGGRGRTKRRVLRFGRADAAALAVALLFAAGAVLVGRVWVF
jgi:energy-coupling factor transport system permease protein